MGRLLGVRRLMTLTPEMQLELRDAKDRAGSFLGAAKVAAFNGWSIGFFAALSIMFGVFSRTSFLVGVGLAIVARNEFVGRSRLRSIDPSGLELLWRNQVGFMALIIVYCLWSMFRTVALPGAGMEALMELFGEGAADLVAFVTTVVYSTVIVATAIFQGLNARYYFVRAARLRDYVRDTPQWVLDMQRATLLE